MDDSGRPAPKKRRRVDLRWVKGRKQRFLDALAATYDMDAACAAAGLDWPTMCRLRSIDPEFAARWEAVIAAGYDRIEAMLLRQAGAGASAGPDKADLALARDLLRHRAAVRKEAAARGKGRPAPSRRPDREAMIASILGKEKARRVAAARSKDEANGSACAGTTGTHARGTGPGSAGAAPA